LDGWLPNIESGLLTGALDMDCRLILRPVIHACRRRTLLTISWRNVSMRGRFGWDVCSGRGWISLLHNTTAYSSDGGWRPGGLPTGLIGDSLIRW
jgi:hypothetical protein